MEQLLLHLVGDYITQTAWMAKMKVIKFRVAFLHASVYSIPFLLITSSPTALAVILLSHAVIDHYRLARYVIFFKNWVTDTNLKWEDCQATGYSTDIPPWMSVWLMIITDNTMHLTINYMALRWL